LGGVLFFLCLFVIATRLLSSWTSLNGTLILYVHSWKFSRRRQSDSSCKYMKRRYKFSRLSQLPLSGDSQPMQYTHSIAIYRRRRDCWFIVYWWMDSTRDVREQKSTSSQSKCHWVF
jgi:hypothetical protein